MASPCDDVLADYHDEPREEEKQTTIPLLPEAKGAGDRARVLRANQVDLHIPKGSLPYAITISPKDTYSPEESGVILNWHASFEQVLLVREDRPGDGTEHYHSIVVSPVKQAHTLTKQLTRLFERKGLEFSKATLQIKTSSRPIGWFGYLMKEVTEAKPYLLLKGWKPSFIRTTLLKNHKKIPSSVLMGDACVVNAKTATRTITGYARIRSLSVRGKECFAHVMVLMMKDGYQFDGIKIKWAYAQTQAMVGDIAKAEDMILQELRFLM